MAPLISVIVPVYNTAPFLRECVDSLLHQTFSDFELLLVDDGSTDDSPAICDDYAARDNRIRVIHQENRGLSGARNAGIDAAKGTYLSFVDSDDAVAPRYLEALWDAARSAQIAVGQFVKFSGRLPEACEGGSVEQISGKEAIHWVNRCSDDRIPMVVAWGKLYERSLFASLRYQTGKWHEDEFLIHRLYGAAAQVAVTAETLYYYRQHGESFMAGENMYRQEKHLDFLLALEDRVAYCAESFPDLTEEAMHQLFERCDAFYSSFRGNLQLQQRVLNLYRKNYRRSFRLLGTKERLRGLLFAYCTALFYLQRKRNAKHAA